MSLSETGLQSNSASALTRGANDSIASLFAVVRWGAFKCCGQRMQEEGRTSQFSRIKQRPPATDLRGPKASAESLTPRRSNLAVADAVDPQPGLFSFAAVLDLAPPPGRRPSGT